MKCAADCVTACDNERKYLCGFCDDHRLCISLSLTEIQEMGLPFYCSNCYFWNITYAIKPLYTTRFKLSTILDNIKHLVYK